MNLDEKIRIYLTDVARGRDTGKVADLSNHVMVSVSDFYKKPSTADGFRENYGMTKIHSAGWDSGGFQFLMGKLKVPGMVRLKGISTPVPPNARATIDLYKRIGAQKHDLPIQLDLPPRYDLPPEQRRLLIEQSAVYYWEMVQELPTVVPTIHGWTLEEIEYNLELVEDPDKLAAGSMVPMANSTWTMGNMNPHNGRVAAGMFVAPKKSATASMNGMWGQNRKKKKKIAVGSYKPLDGSVNYIEHTDNVANSKRKELRRKRKRIATAAPGTLDVRGGKAFVDMVKSRHKKQIVATPAPGRVDSGISQPNNMPSRRKARINTKKKKKTVPYGVIIDRITMVMNRLREDYDVFILGGASPHMTHQVFLSGAKWTDTSAWRIKAVLGEIYLPDHSSGHSSFGVGYSQKARINGRLHGPERMDDEAVRILKDCLADPRHPYSGMYWKDFMRVAHMLMPKFKREVLKRNYPARPFVLRARHNAFVLKFREEETANEYINDPDRYYKYLKKRLAPRKILSNRLTKLWNKLKRPYVQSDLRVYAKERAK